MQILLLLQSGCEAALYDLPFSLQTGALNMRPAVFAFLLVTALALAAENDGSRSDASLAYAQLADSPEPYLDVDRAKVTFVNSGQRLAFAGRGAHCLVQPRSTSTCTGRPTTASAARGKSSKSVSSRRTTASGEMSHPCLAW